MRLLLTAILIFFNPQINFAQKNNNSTTDETVYITESGSKYHTSSCSYLSKSKIEKKLSEIQGSYSACSRCVSKSQGSSSTRQDYSSSGSNKSNVETHSGRTKSGATIHTGPRGGKYHYSKSGKKVYERKRK